MLATSQLKAAAAFSELWESWPLYASAKPVSHNGSRISYKLCVIPCDTRYLFNLASSVGSWHSPRYYTRLQKHSESSSHPTHAAVTFASCNTSRSSRTTDRSCNAEPARMHAENATIHGFEPNHHTFIFTSK